MNSRLIPAALALIAATASLTATACEQCKCQGANSVELLSTRLDEAYRSGLKSPPPQQEPPVPQTTQSQPQQEASTPALPLPTPATPIVEASARRYRWYFDTLFEFISYDRVSVARAHAIIDSGRDTHAHTKELDVTQRFAYDVSDDLQLSLAQGFRALYQKEIEDAAILGEHERSQGATDLDAGIQYRFLHQRACGFPVDLLLFADIKAPTGTTNNRRPNGELFETEDQPGTGSVNETLGVSAGRRFGTQGTQGGEWGVTAAYAYTHKGEGSQRFKEGDVNRLTLTASHRLSPDSWRWKLFFSQGVQAFVENEARDHGSPSKDHGGEFVYAVPAVTLQPFNHLVLTATGAVPVYQQENGFHQKDRFTLQFNVGVRF